LRQAGHGAGESLTDKITDLKTYQITGNCSQPELILTKDHPTDKNLDLPDPLNNQRHCQHKKCEEKGNAKAPKT
jgi:hypothetical protein